MASQSELISFTPNPAGNKTLLLNSGTFTPSTVLLWAGARSGTTETTNFFSLGAIDIPNGLNTARSNITDGTGSQSIISNTVWRHRNRVAGTISDVITITGVSAAAGSVTVNIGTATTAYTVYGIAIA